MANNIYDPEEKALAMYKETVTPPRGLLGVILGELPERREYFHTQVRTVRSPYIWLGVSQLVSLCFVFAIFIPGLITSSNDADYFLGTDRQIERFEAGINEADYQNMLLK